MNRYQQEVALIDDRRRRRLRIVGALGLSAFTVFVLWAAGVRPSAFWKDVTPEPQRARARTAAPGTPAAAPAAPRTAPPKPLPGLDSSVSPVPQRLYLVSTAPGRNAKQGTARLGISRENPQTYVSGAVLANGARLAEIYKDRVILERRGQRTTLYVSASIDAGIEGAQELAMVGGAIQPPPTFTPFVDPFVEVVRAMPFYENDVLAGVQVFPGQKSSKFAALGLQSRDVIVAIDGAPVFDAGVALERLRTLNAGAALIVTARRGEQTVQLSLDGAALTKTTETPIFQQDTVPALP